VVDRRVVNSGRNRSYARQLLRMTRADVSHSLAATAVHSGAAGYIYATINVVTSKNFPRTGGPLLRFLQPGVVEHRYPGSFLSLAFCLQNKMQVNRHNLQR